MPDPQDHVVTASAEPAAIDWLEDGQMRSAPWLSLAGVAATRRCSWTRRRLPSSATSCASPDRLLYQANGSSSENSSRNRPMISPSSVGKA